MRQGRDQPPVSCPYGKICSVFGGLLSSCTRMMLEFTHEALGILCQIPLPFAGRLYPGHQPTHSSGLMSSTALFTLPPLHTHTHSRMPYSRNLGPFPLSYVITLLSWESVHFRMWSMLTFPEFPWPGFQGTPNFLLSK